MSDVNYGLNRPTTVRHLFWWLWWWWSGYSFFVWNKREVVGDICQYFFAAW